jgi:hypothetical protein
MENCSLRLVQAEKLVKPYLKKKKTGVVVYSYNPSYLRDGGRRFAM